MDLAISAKKQAVESSEAYRAASLMGDKQYRSLLEQYNQRNREVDRLKLVLKQEESRREEMEKTLRSIQSPVTDAEPLGRKRTRASTGGLDIRKYKEK